MSDRLRYLEEMGLGPVWVLRRPGAGLAEESPPAGGEGAAMSAVSRAPATDPGFSSHQAPAPAESVEQPVVQPAMPEPGQHDLEPFAPAVPAVETVSQPAVPLDGPPPDMEPPPFWVEEPVFFPEDFELPEALAVPSREAEIAALDWAGLRRAVAECRACALCQKRKQAVLGVGDESPDWLVVGEGPGAEEDEKGEPFVGQAGKLLDNMLAALGLRRGAGAYIGNAVKCRPPGNRTPEPAEIAACFPFLRRQITLLQPKIILALGRPAVQALLDTEVKIGAARGRLFDYEGIPVIVSYHPAYLLRNTADKAKAWEDLCFARATLRRRNQAR